ncbi:hypothetical protein [Aureliella helgolandensis]|uniref:hypothetical protein n=1 Tax=Aureliella helgolandensis TaxID=2527968 RepID=UPI0018D07E46|nr:hypothetical protein [Aureliella helgolandensis]
MSEALLSSWLLKPLAERIGIEGSEAGSELKADERSPGDAGSPPRSEVGTSTRKAGTLTLCAVLACGGGLGIVFELGNWATAAALLSAVRVEPVAAPLPSTCEATRVASLGGEGVAGVLPSEAVLPLLSAAPLALLPGRGTRGTKGARDSESSATVETLPVAAMLRSDDRNAVDLAVDDVDGAVRDLPRRDAATLGGKSSVTYTRPEAGAESVGAAPIPDPGIAESVMPERWARSSGLMTAGREG